MAERCWQVARICGFIGMLNVKSRISESQSITQFIRWFDIGLEFQQELPESSSRVGCCEASGNRSVLVTQYHDLDKQLMAVGQSEVNYKLKQPCVAGLLSKLCAQTAVAFHPC